jgi:hypothetical protein
MEPFPTFQELKNFIKNNQRVTICEIRDKFNQKGSDICAIIKPGCKNKHLILAYSINKDFFTYLQKFMKNDYVAIDLDPLACMISDTTTYTGKGEFSPIVLSIQELI